MPCFPALERWQAVGFEDTAVSVITESEVLSSLYAQGSEQQFHYYQHALRGRVRVLPVDARIGRLYARLKARQFKTGEPVADAELMIAATAQTHGLVLATLERPAFQRIEGLVWEDWS